MKQILNDNGYPEVEIWTLVNRNQPAESYSVVWDWKDNFGKEIAGGICFLQMKAKEFVQIKKLLLLK